MNNNNFAKKLLTTLSVMSIVISLADVAHGTKHKKNKRNKSSANVTHSPKPVVTSALVPSIPTPSSRSSSVASHESSASTTGSEVMGGAHGTPTLEPPVVTSALVPSIPTPRSRSSSVASHESAASTGSTVSDGMPDTSSHTSIPRPSPPSSSATASKEGSSDKDIAATSDVSDTKKATGTRTITEVGDICDPSSTPPKKKTTATSTSSTSSPPSKHIKRITSSHTTASKEGLSDDDIDETSDVSHTKEAIGTGTEVGDIYDPSSTPPKKKTTATSTSSTSSPTYGSRSSSAASRTSATSSATGISDTSSYASTGESSSGETTSSSRNIANSIYSTLVSNNNADANQPEQDESDNLINELAGAYRSDTPVSDSTREKTKEVVSNLDQSEIDDLQNAASSQVDSDQRSSESNAALYAIIAVSDLDDSTQSRKKSANDKQSNVDRAVSDTLTAVTDAIHSRRKTTVVASDIELTDSNAGISAGDDDAGCKITRGLWIKGIYGTAKQSRVKNHDGYKSTSYGSVIGFDLDFDDQFVIGAGYSPVRSRIKLSKSSDKTLATSHIFSIYGNYWFNNAISVDGIIQAGLSHIDTKRVDNKKIAKGKLRNNTYSAESTLNYQVKTGDVFITPKAGLKYISFHDGSFKEKGAGIYNMVAKGRNTKEFSGILGVNVMMPHKISDDLTIKPSVDASLIYKLNERKDAVRAKLSWMNDYFKAEAGNNSKKSLYKAQYGVGADFAVQYKNTELSAAYHLVMHKKYQGHQGSLALKVLF